MRTGVFALNDVDDIQRCDHVAQLGCCDYLQRTLNAVGQCSMTSPALGRCPRRRCPTPLSHGWPMGNNVPASAPRQIITLDRPGSVTTESSVYAFDGRGRYQRLPRNESGPRPATPCIDDSLDDGRWIEYREMWIESHPFVPGRSRLGIIPSQRSEDFHGIRTGVIVGSTYERVLCRLPEPTLHPDITADDDIRQYRAQ